MATTYEETTVTSQTTNEGVSPDIAFVKSIRGILKIVEFVLCIIILICASIDYWYHLGAGWVQFVAGFLLVGVIIYFILHFFRIIYRLPGPWAFIEFISHCIACVLLLIAAIVAAVRAPLAPSIGATTFFTFLCLAVFVVDTFFWYREWQSVQHPASTGGSTAATTTTTTTTYETRTQY